MTEVAFEETLAGRPDQTAQLARAARALIRELHPDVVEVPWPKQGVIGYGIGPKKYSQHYAYLALYGDLVNIGFNQGAELDPGRPVERIGTADWRETLRDPDLIRLLRQAKQHRERTPAGSIEPAQGVTATRSSTLRVTPVVAALDR